MIHMLFQALSGRFTDSPGQPFFFFVYSESIAVPFLAGADGLHFESGQNQYRFAGIRPRFLASTPVRAVPDIPCTENSWCKPQRSFSVHCCRLPRLALCRTAGDIPHRNPGAFHPPRKYARERHPHGCPVGAGSWRPRRSHFHRRSTGNLPHGQPRPHWHPGIETPSDPDSYSTRMQNTIARSTCSPPIALLDSCCSNWDNSTGHSAMPDHREGFPAGVPAHFCTPVRSGRGAAEMCGM